MSQFVFTAAFHSGRGACLTFLAVMCTLAITVVQNVTYLHKNASAVATIYKKSYINCTYAGESWLNNSEGYKARPFP